MGHDRMKDLRKKKNIEREGVIGAKIDLNDNGKHTCKQSQEPKGHQNAPVTLSELWGQCTGIMWLGIKDSGSSSQLKNAKYFKCTVKNANDSIPDSLWIDGFAFTVCSQKTLSCQISQQ